MPKRILVVGASVPSCLRNDVSITVVHQPLIELKMLPYSKKDLCFIDKADIIILTSKHAADFLQKALSHKLLLSTIPFYCVGPSTAQRAAQLFQNPLYTAATHTQEGLIELILTNKPSSAFWPRSSHARKKLPNTLRKAGIRLYELALYTPLNIIAPLPLDGIDEVFFTSPSSVTAFFSQVSTPPRLPLVAIGPITAKKLQTVLASFNAMSTLQLKTN